MPNFISIFQTKPLYLIDNDNNFPPYNSGLLNRFVHENFTLSLAEWYSSCVCYGCEMSRGGPLSPCPICHSLSALHLPQNLEEEKRGLITLEPGLTAAVQLEFSWNFYLRNSSRCNHQALALGIGFKKMAVVRNSTGNDVN